MRAQHEATVNRAALIAILKRLPTRKGPVRKRGVRSAVPLDVLIYADGGALVIEGPMMASRLPMTGAWNTCVSVRARTLAIIGANLKAAETITMTLVAESLVFDHGAFVIPSQIVSRPE